jgi:hypothetical protein
VNDTPNGDETMNATKAPKGGIVSQVNGQFYPGGEFVPDHGLFCGKKGAKRTAKREKAITANRYVELIDPATPGAKMIEVFTYDPKASHIHYPIAIVVAMSELEARNHFPGKPIITQPI